MQTKKLFTLVMIVFLITAVPCSGKNILTEFEIGIGQMVSSGLEEQFSVSNDPALNAQVNNVGLRLTQTEYAKREGIKYQFKVLDTSEINAFAVPGGFVYATKGLLQNFGPSEDELAFVLAHEITHIKEKHGMKQLGIGIALGAILGNKENFAKNIIKQLLVSGRSRKDEAEADANGVKLAIEAGYNPAGALAAMRRLETLNQKEPNALERLFLTHPPTKERAEKIKDTLIQTLTGSDYKATVPYIPIAESFDFPVGPLDKDKSSGVPLDRETFEEGGWGIGTRIDENKDGIIDGGWLDKSYVKGKMHCGVDINYGAGSEDLGKPVFAIAKGVILDIRQPTNNKNDRWRGIVLIGHRLPNNTLVASQYAHLGTIAVQKGQEVLKGQLLGTIGPTPYKSTSPHLHFEMRDDLRIKIDEDPYRTDSKGWIDPLKFITEHRMLTLPEVKQPRNEILLEKGPIHLGDDNKDSKIIWIKEFELSEEDLANRSEAKVRLRVKGTPKKDPVISFNRQNVGYAVTNTDKWEWFEFDFKPNILHPGKNLIDIETLIPNIYDTFDDCEFADVSLLLK